MADPQQKETFSNVQPVETFSDVQPTAEQQAKDQQAKADMPTISATPGLWDRTKSFLQHPYENISTGLSNVETKVMGDPTHPLTPQTSYLGARPLTQGVSPAAAQIVGGPIMAPIHAAQAANEFAGGHPVKGINKTAQTASDVSALIPVPGGELLPRAIAAVGGSKIGSAVAGAVTDDPDYKNLAGNIGGAVGAGAPEIAKTAPVQTVADAGLTVAKTIRHPLQAIGSAIEKGAENQRQKAFDALPTMQKLGVQDSNVLRTQDEAAGNTGAPTTQNLDYPKGGTMSKLPDGTSRITTVDGKSFSLPPNLTEVFTPGRAMPPRIGPEISPEMQASRYADVEARAQGAALKDVPPPTPVAPPIDTSSTTFAGEKIHPADSVEPAEIDNKPQSSATRLKENLSTSNETSFGGRQERLGPKIEAGEQPFQMTDTNLRGTAKRLGASNQSAFDLSDPAHQEAAASLLDMKQPRAAELANEMSLKGRSNWKADDFKWSSADRKTSGSQINPDKEALFGEILKGSKMEDVPAKVSPTAGGIEPQPATPEEYAGNRSRFPNAADEHTDQFGNPTISGGAPSTAIAPKISEPIRIEGAKVSPAADVALDEATSNARKAARDRAQMISRAAGRGSEITPVDYNVGRDLKEGEQSRPFADPISSTTYGANNKLVSVDEAAQASANFQNKLFRSHAGIDPTMLGDAAKLAAHHLEAGARELAPTFYSKAAKVADEKIGGSGSGDQILSTLRNAGVKENEIKWMGLDDYLSGKPKVSKSDLQQFIKDNQIQLEETTKGGSHAEQLEQLGSQRNQVFAENNRIWANSLRREPLSTELFNEMAEKGNPESVISRMPAALQAEVRRFVETDQQIHRFDKQIADLSKQASRAKFENYTLPGEKSNYTEMLLRLPVEESAQRLTLNGARQAYNEFVTRLRDRLNDPGANPFHEISAEMGRMTPEERNEFQRLDHRLTTLREGERPGTTQTFRSSHFDEPNVLAHIRFNDRTAADGSKTLFLEEVQSDWHQQGKKYGYQSADSAKANREFQAFRQTLEDKYSTPAFWGKVTPEERATYGQLVDRANAETADKSIPNAPFKSDWHELAMKRMLRHAAENDYDKLAWTTGEQQAARYDLSKHVSRLEYLPDKKMLRAFDTNGHFIFDKEVEPEKIGDYVGKEPARKLLESELKQTGGGNPIHSIEGDGLKVGGDWAKALYDRAIPNFLNKYGKKWDAKVGETQLPDAVGLNEHFDLTETPGGWRLVDKRQNQGQGTFVGPVFKTGGAAEKWLSEQGYLNQKVHSLDITPAMKKSVLKEGQPISKINPPSIQPLRYDS